MTNRIIFRVNTASPGEVARHLRLCDTRYSPTLSSRIDIDTYAAKIVGRAVRFEAWIDSQLVGLVAAYLNDTEDSCAFITNVSVIEEMQRTGTASGLIQRCICCAKKIGIEQVELEVLEGNTRAVKLYEKLGFSRRDSRCGRMIISVDNGVGLRPGSPGKLYSEND
jgi:ribosomal protein S18 acetylase RimI-like enzyme